MTIAEQVDALVERIINEGKYKAVTLTQLFVFKKPVTLQSLGQDEIAFIYSDGSRFVTAICDEDEWNEFLSLAAEGRTTEK